ncbi:MAG: epoxyqueuosine reductase QueH, partial [Clostridia bacterium]|nr:epoxyqueuosine reductase QueH [Clostridia bacterium]
MGVIDNVKEGNDITLYFYNPNLYPFSEYQKRLDTLKEVVEKAYPYLQIIEGDFDDSSFYDNVLGLEDEKEGGSRCANCIKMRMEMTA